MSTLKLIATYARVSTARQEEEETIKTQINTLAEHSQKNNYTIVQEYHDEGWSGDTLARPALDQLREDAKKKLWDAVLIYDPDRLARRYSYQELVMDELRDAGIEVIFVTVAAPKNSEDKILYGVRGLFAEYERTKITERLRLGKIRKIKEGNILVSLPLYGYNYVAKQDKVHGYYEICPQEAEVVKMIFTWVGDRGLTLGDIVRRLHEMEIKPRKSSRGVWSRSTLSVMLRNKAYIGQAHWGSKYAVVPEIPFLKEKYRKVKKSSRRTKPESEWFTVPVPAIIDEQLFIKTRLQLQENFALLPRNAKNQYLISGKIYCTCGRKRSSGSALKGKNLYYRCMNRALNFPLPKTCNEKALNARQADQLVWQKVSGLMCSAELLNAQITRSFDQKQTDMPKSGINCKEIEQELAKLKAAEARYNEAYGEGVFSVDDLRSYIQPIRQQMRELDTLFLQTCKEADVEHTQVKPEDHEVVSFSVQATCLLTHDLSFEQKKSIILSVIDKIIGTKEKLVISGYIPISNHVALNSICTDSRNIIRHFKCDPKHTIPFEITIDLNES